MVTSSLVVKILGVLLAMATVGSPVGLEPMRDQWLPYSDNRIVSPTGAYYAVLHAKASFSAGPFSLHKRRAGVAPLQPAESETWIYNADKEKEAAKIAPDPKDDAVFAGTLPRLPMEAKVSDAPVGVLLFDTYASLGHGPVLSFLDSKGKETWSLDLKALFGGVPKGAQGSVSSIDWSKSWGLDAQRRTAWVLTKGHEFREVSLATGKISRPEPLVVARWCTQGENRDRIHVLDAIVRGASKVDPAYLTSLEPLVNDAKEPLAIRMRAAAACRRAGSTKDYKTLFVQATTDKDPSVAAYAVTHLGTSVPEDHGPYLRAFVLRCKHEVDPRSERGSFLENYTDVDLANAFRAMGPRGVQLLVALVDDDAVAGLARLNASALLSMLGNKAIQPGLLALCRDNKLANSALNVLIWRDPPLLRETLCGLALAGSGDDARISLYFGSHPWSGAIPAMQAVQKRLAQDQDTEHMWVRAALRACKAEQESEKGK